VICAEAPTANVTNERNEARNISGNGCVTQGKEEGWERELSCSWPVLRTSTPRPIALIPLKIQAKVITSFYKFSLFHKSIIISHTVDIFGYGYQALRRCMRTERAF
jgi:hypothetical protein